MIATAACQGPLPRVSPETVSGGTEGSGLSAFEATPTPGIAPSEVDAVGVLEGSIPIGVACGSACDEAGSRLAGLLAALAGGRTPSDGPERLAGIERLLTSAVEPAVLLRTVHPVASVRAAALACEASVDAVRDRAYGDRSVASMLDALEPSSLDDARRTYVERARRECRRRGAWLGADDRQRLARLDVELADAEAALLAIVDRAVPVLRVEETALTGTPEAFRRAHPPDALGRVALAADREGITTMARYARDRTVALRMQDMAVRLDAPDDIAAVRRLTERRHEKAKLLGWASWSDLMLEGRGVGSRVAAEAWVTRLEDGLRTLERGASARGRAAVRGPRAEARRFVVHDVVRGLFAIAQDAYGVSFHESDGPAWAPGVRTFRVLREGRELGRLWIDGEPREGKPREPATFRVGAAGLGPGGRRRLPLVAIVGTWPTGRAALGHEDVLTVVHEFGHALHHLMVDPERADAAGTPLPPDVAECPAQLVEEWAWSMPILERLVGSDAAREPGVRAELEAVVRERNFVRAETLRRDVEQASIDLALHGESPRHDRMPPRTALRHLVEQGGAYVAYPWSLAVAVDAQARWRDDGPLSEGVTAEWRDRVLAVGAAHDVFARMGAFIGHPPDERALLESLRRP